MFADQMSPSCFVFQLGKRSLLVSDTLDPAFSSFVAGVTATDDAKLTSYPAWQPELQVMQPLMQCT